jgi:hypothetical protein
MRILYPLWLWLTTLVIAPLLLSLFALSGEGLESILMGIIFLFYMAYIIHFQF